MIFDERFRHLTTWIGEQGFIEIGRDDFSSSLIRVLDPGGIIWEGADSYPSIEDALAAAEEGLVSWMREQGFPVA